MKFLRVEDDKYTITFINIELIETIYFNKNDKSIKVIDKNERWYHFHEGDPNFEYIKNMFFADETPNIVML